MTKYLRVGIFDELLVFGDGFPCYWVYDRGTEMLNVIHPITGETITKYQKLIKDPHTKDIWAWRLVRKLET